MKNNKKTTKNVHEDLINNKRKENKLEVEPKEDFNEKFTIKTRFTEGRMKHQ